MADKTSPLANSESDKNNIQKNLANSETGSADHRRNIFDERFSLVMDGFGNTCETQSISTAIAIAMHPDEKTPLIFLRGHEYDVAVLLARVLRSIKEKLGSELEA